MWYILSILVGIFIGCFISISIRKPKYVPRNVGILNVVESDDSSPYLMVELSESPYNLFNEKTVSMTIKPIHQRSQK